MTIKMVSKGQFYAAPAKTRTVGSQWENRPLLSASLSYCLVHSLRRGSSLMDRSRVRLLSFHYRKLLSMNNSTAASGLPCGCDGAFTPNLIADLNTMFGHGPQSCPGMWSVVRH